MGINRRKRDSLARITRKKIYKIKDRSKRVGVSVEEHKAVNGEDMLQDGGEHRYSLET